MSSEFFLIGLALLIGLGGPLLAILLSIVALAKSRRIDELTERIQRLEAATKGADTTARAEVSESIEARDEMATREAEVAVDQVAQAEPRAPMPVRPTRQAIDWETFIGQKALGWSAVLLLVFAAAFFLRYAYQNSWIGPLGRVSIGAVVGAGLVVAGLRYERRGWRIFSQMLSAGGIVVVYLATYSAFGFYRLLPQHHAGAFLVAIVIQSMVIAALYDSLAIGLVAVIGGLLTPLLMYSDTDTYVALFTYLVVIDVGTVVLMLSRGFPLIGSVALLGTHLLFWSWYEQNYHPEKHTWALGFQAAVYGVFLAHSVVAQLIRKRSWFKKGADAVAGTAQGVLRTTAPDPFLNPTPFLSPVAWEGLARFVATAALWFGAFYTLMQEDYAVWMGSAAVGMATVYSALARFTLAWKPEENRLMLTALAVSVGFIALAFPIQAEASWIALGWAAVSAALWWFGQRVSAAALRIMATVLAGLAVGRLMFFDLPPNVREPFVPILNEFALPSIGVVACIMLALACTRPMIGRRNRAERFLAGVAGLGSILLLWFVLSIDCHGYFIAQSRLPEVDAARWRFLGQLSLSVLWAVYASVILAVGFRIDLSRLRWLAISLYGLTVGKVLFVDMSNLRQFYRILAFFILAIVLGLAARAYQRLRPDGENRDTQGTQNENL